MIRAAAKSKPVESAVPAGAVLVRPVRTEADHKAALKRIEELWNAAPDTPEGDELDVLLAVAGAYEDEHFSEEFSDGDIDPVEFLKASMEFKGLRPADLKDQIGPPGRVSEILNRKRRLTLDMIQSLHTDFGIAAEILIQPYELNKKSGRSRAKRPRP